MINIDDDGVDILHEVFFDSLSDESEPGVSLKDALARDFPVNATTPIEAVVTFGGPVSAPAERSALASYTARLAQVPGILSARVTGVAGNVAKVDMRFTANGCGRGYRA